MPVLEPLLERILVCPRDHRDLRLEDTALVCAGGHRYPCVDGIPVMLLEEAEPTLAVCAQSIQQAELGVSLVRNNPLSDRHPVDSFVRQAIAGTNGHMYRHLIDFLPRYPIPELRLPESSGQVFLDIGCNWGRWCVAAARKGYLPVGIDPSLEAILAARRVAQQLGVSAYFLVADARYLPLRKNSFDVVFSYSVLQHFSELDVNRVLAQAARILKPSGTCFVQMAATYGARNLFNQLRRGFRQPKGFEVRYWKPAELLNTFNKFIGATSLSVDGFFSLNVQPSDLDLLPLQYRLVVWCSEMLRHASEKVRWLAYFADSLYVNAVLDSSDGKTSFHPTAGSD